MMNKQQADKACVMLFSSDPELSDLGRELLNNIVKDYQEFLERIKAYQEKINPSENDKERVEKNKV